MTIKDHEGIGTDAFLRPYSWLDVTFPPMVSQVFPLFCWLIRDSHEQENGCWIVLHTIESY